MVFHSVGTDHERPFGVGVVVHVDRPVPKVVDQHVLDGVRIGKGAVVGAGAVVTKDLPANSISSGVPARVLKMRSSPSSDVDWWKETSNNEP